MKKIFLILLMCVSQGILANNVEHNKKVVLAFYDELLNQKNFAAAERYLGEQYTQHNPNVADGKEGLKNYIKILSEKFPKLHADVKRVIAEDDYVILHVNTLLEPNTKGLAITDIFKLANGKIIEHWDVIQPVPDTSENDNGMF